MTETKLTSDLPKPNEGSQVKLLSLVVLLSFIFGVAGSAFGNVFFEKKDLTLPGEIKTIEVNEESAVVEVVKKSSPAVVSIIISKDLNKLPGFSSSPNDFGPFSFDPFFNSRGNTDSSQPNIQEVGGGTGFIITSEGLIATNKHVVDDTTATYTVLTNDGNKYDAKVLSRDPVNDLALVKIEASGLPTLALGDSSNLQIGQRVIAIGNSLGQYRNTVTTGVVSGIGRTIIANNFSSGSEQLEGVIQTDAAINFGNSGGPLLDIGGSVIGINTAIDAQGQLVGFAIPSNDLKKDIESYNQFGRIVKPFLGVRYVVVTPSIKEQNNLNVDYGALLTGNSSSPAVIKNSAADKAGLKNGDVILEVNGTRIDQEHSLASILKNYNPNDVVKMKILSGTEERELTVTLGESK